MFKEITFKELLKKDSALYEIIDVRSDVDFLYGHIMGAKNIPVEILLESFKNKSRDKQYYIYSNRGNTSKQATIELSKLGFDVTSIKGGYADWLANHYQKSVDNEIAINVEESIRKKFHSSLFSKFARAINTYELIQPNDKIAVCISGGKDSMLMAKLFQELKRHNKFDFELVFLIMDPGYSKQNRDMIEKNAQMLGVPITIFETEIFDSVFNIEKSPCYICARMRRGHLYNKAKELGCNKIALGHHYDDVIETILMGMLYGGQVQTMMPKINSTNYSGMELIRPMYLIRESDIVHWREYNKLQFIQCACKFTSTCSTNQQYAKDMGSRQKVKQLIKKLQADDPQIEANIFKSVENVNLATIISYKDFDGKEHNFKEEYNKRKNR